MADFSKDIEELMSALERDANNLSERYTTKLLRSELFSMYLNDDFSRVYSAGFKIFAITHSPSVTQKK